MFQGFKSDLTTLEGWELECLTISIFQTLGYYVESNLKWLEDRVGAAGTADILELDVLSKSYSPLKITKIVTECKRGCDFNDFFKFLGISSFVKVDAKYLICQSSQFADLYSLGIKNDMVVIKPEDIFNTFTISDAEKLSVFRGVSYILLALINKQKIQDDIHQGVRFTAKEEEAYSEIRSYLSLLVGRVWRESDPRDQFKILNNIFETKRDFVRKIARKIGLGNGVSENFMYDNALCQAAGYLVLKAKISYIICAVECAINSVISPESNYLNQITDEGFRQCVILMRENLSLSCKIPNFIQTWIYQFGGFLNKYGNDIDEIAKCMNERRESIVKIIEFLQRLFTILSTTYGIQWGFLEDMEILHFRYVPQPIRGLGIAYRKHLGLDVRDFCFGTQWESKFLNWISKINLTI